MTWQEKETKKLMNQLKEKENEKKENKTKVEFPISNKAKKTKQINTQNLHTLFMTQQ